MYAKTYVVPIVADVIGGGIGYTPVVTGRVLQIRYVKPASGGFADGVDFDVTLENSGVVVWDQDNVNASATVLPRQATHTTAGAAANYAATFPVLEPVVVDSERVQVVVANGGSGGETGTFYVTIG